VSAPATSEFLVEIEVVGEVPADRLDDLRRAEGARAAELADAGVLVRLWRPAGEGWRNVGLWRAADRAALDAAIASLPLAPYLSARVRPLSEHPNDPGR